MALQFTPTDVEVIAKALLGEPTARQPGELRFGSHGSFRVNLQMGSFNSYENPEDKGNVLGLIKRERGLEGKDAIEFIRSLGVHVPDDRPAANGRAIRNGASNEAEKINEPAQKAKLVKTYDYVDEAGALLFQACRMEPKSFRQRRPDGKGGWVWKLDGVRQVPYRLPELIEDIAEGLRVYIAEGEKDVDALRALGLPATCNAAGAGKWPASLTPFFNGADVVILPDNDMAGTKHAMLVANALWGAANSIRVLNLPGLPEKGDVSDWLEAGGDDKQLRAMADATGPWTPPPSAPEGEPWDGEPSFQDEGQQEWRSRFGAVALASINDPGPEYEHLIKGVLTRGEVSMLVGPSGSGKSFLATHASLCIARGAEFLAPIGRPAPRVRRGGVLYVAGEGARGLKKRLRAYLQHYGVDNPADVPFVLLTLPLDLHSSDEPTQMVIDEARHHSAAFLARHSVQLELLVIDTLSASTPGANENASDDVSRVLARCQRIGREADCAVMLVHHMNASGVRERGHSSLRANVDSVIEVVKTEARDAHPPMGRIIRTAKITKQKDGEDGLTFRFVLPSVHLGTDADGDPITSCAVSAPDMGDYDEAVSAEKDKAPKLSTQMTIVLRAIDAALTEHGVEAPTILRLPRTLKVVEWKHVRDAYAKISSDGDDEADEEKKKAVVRQALKRGGDELLRRRVIGRENPWVWRTGKRAAGEAQTEPQAENVVPFQRSDEDAPMGGFDL